MCEVFLHVGKGAAGDIRGRLLFVRRGAMMTSLRIGSAIVMFALTIGASLAFRLA